jgi:hypothetical protein
MAYQINRFNRALLTTVEDGTLDETTDIKFVGKNYAGYGEVHNENFLFLLEHFAGSNEPTKPVSGQLWFDTGAQRMKFRDSNNKWRTVGGAEVGASQPAGLATGDFWWDSSNEQLYVYNGTEYILIGPQDAGDGITQMISQTIIDTTDVSRSVIVSFVNDVPVHVISPTEFTIKNVAGNTLDGFGTIRQGITLRDTNNDTGETTSLYRFYGTATDADRLGGFTASDFASSASPSFNSIIEAPGAGLIAGGVFSFSVVDGAVGDQDYGVIKNISGPSNDIRFVTLNGSGTQITSLKITADGVFPLLDNTFDLGSTTLKFNDVNATNFNGTATNATKLRLGLTGTDYRYASEANVAGTIAVRDANKTITADIFSGIASQARFADLAEKYTVEKQHPVGTVMYVCENAEYEIAPCWLDSYPVGVTSAEPAYLMNKDLVNGQAIALEGRVPVRILGAVRKGDKVYVDAEGCASTHYNGNPLVGIALETNSEESEKLVECILKL